MRPYYACPILIRHSFTIILREKWRNHQRQKRIRFIFMPVSSWITIGLECDRQGWIKWELKKKKNDNRFCRMVNEPLLAWYIIYLVWFSLSEVCNLNHCIEVSWNLISLKWVARALDISALYGPWCLGEMPLNLVTHLTCWCHRRALWIRYMTAIPKDEVGVIIENG